jgi:hypothetical protein
MFNSIIVATAAKFQGNADKNGKSPIFLNIVSGKCPNRNVLSGTVAENIGLEEGKTYLLQVREIESDAKYGRRFTYAKLAEMGALEILQAQSLAGKAELFDAGQAEVVETPAVTGADVTAQ